MSKISTSIGIDQALLDPGLLGSALGPAGTWQTWLVTLKAAFGITLNRTERRAFAAVAGSRKPPAKRVAELWAIVGRGGGKSRMAAAIGMFIACFVPHKLAHGETGHVLILAGSRDQAQVVFGYALAFLQSSPILRQLIKSRTAFEIRLTNGIVLAVHSNSFRHIRGRSLIACICDEISFWRDDSSANPDIETYRAVLPSLMRMGGMLIGISTPYRRSGLLFDKYQNHFDVDGDDVLVVRGSTAQFNPWIDSGKIAKAMLADPEAARSEWQAEFRSDLSALFGDRVIDDAVDHTRPLELPPRYGHKYAAFADASAGRNDAFTFCIGHVEGPKDDARWICDVVRGRSAPFDPRSVAQEYANLALDYWCTRVTGDNYAGNWVADAFSDAGIKYDVSPLPKSRLYLEALPVFNRGAISLPEHEKLLRELRMLERRVHRSGKDSVDHPRNGADDLANSVCGALYITLHEMRKPKMRTGAIDTRRLCSLA